RRPVRRCRVRERLRAAGHARAGRGDRGRSRRGQGGLGARRLLFRARFTVSGAVNRARNSNRRARTKNRMDSSYLTMGYALIVVGFLLLVAELFIPTSGTLFVVAAASIALGVTLTFWYDSTTGAWTLAGVFVALPVLGKIFLTYWPRTRIG